MAPACRVHWWRGMGRAYNGLCSPWWGGWAGLTMASVHLDARHFSFSLYTTGAFQAATPVLELRGSESEYVSLFVSSLRGTAWAPEVSSTNPVPDGFCIQKLWELIFLALEPWAWGPGVGLGPLAPEISLLNFYPPHVGEGPAHSMSVPLLPVWMDVISLIP